MAPWICVPAYQRPGFGGRRLVGGVFLNKKISLGAAIAYMAIVAAVVFCLTMFYSENRYNAMYNNILEREREYAILAVLGVPAVDQAHLGSRRPPEGGYQIGIVILGSGGAVYADDQVPSMSAATTPGRSTRKPFGRESPPDIFPAWGTPTPDWLAFGTGPGAAS